MKGHFGGEIDGLELRVGLKVGIKTSLGNQS